MVSPSFFQGLGSGIQTGLVLSQNRQEAELRRKIAELSSLRELQTAEIQKQQLEQQQEAKNYTNTMKNADLFFKATSKMNPIERESYLSNLEEMPFYKNASPDLKPLLKVIGKSSSEDINDFTNSMSTFSNALQKGDINTSAIELFKLQAKFGNTDNPGIISAFKTAADLLGIATKPTSQSKLSTLLSEREQFNPESKEYQLYSQNIEKETKPSAGTTVNVNTDNIEKTTKAALEKAYFANLETIQGLAEVKKTFEPRMLEIDSLWNTLASRAKNKLKIKLSPNERKDLDKFAKVAANTMRIANQQIRELSGAAVTKVEMPRLFTVFPTIDTGTISRFFENTSPQEFQSKLENNYRNALRVQNRLEFIRNSGGSAKIVLGPDNEPIGFIDKNGNKLDISDNRFDLTPQQEMAIKSSFSKDPSELAANLAKEHPDWSEEDIIDAVNKIMEQ